MPLPGDVSTRVVHGAWTDILGAPRSGTVTFTPTAERLIHSGTHTVITGTIITASLNVTGEISVTMPCTDDAELVGQPFAYLVTVDLVGDEDTSSFWIAVPDVPGQLELADVTPILPPTGGTNLVFSVNGQTGVVTLTAADVGAVPTSRQVIAGTGLTGGGALTADRTLNVSYGTTAGTAAQGNDTRIAAATPLTPVGQQRLEMQRETALRTFHAALANRRYGACNIAVLGASSTEGVGPTLHSRRYLSRMTAALRSACPVPGVVGGENYVPAYAASAVTFTWPVALSGGATTVSNAGWALKAALLSAGGHTLTYSFTGTSVSVWYSQNTTLGVFAVSIDGVSHGTVDTAGALDRNAKWTSPALTAGRHTITVTYSSGGSVFIYGFASYDGDESVGIRVFDGGRGGLQTGTLATNSIQWAPRLTTIQPHLVMYQPGANDYLNNIASATFKANIVSVIATIRANTTTNPSIVLQSAPLTGSASQAEPWDNYRTALEEIAAEDVGGPGGASGVVVWDSALRWASPLVDNTLGIYTGDNLHATDLGHQLWASELAGFLLTGYTGQDGTALDIPQEWGASTPYLRGQQLTNLGFKYQVTTDHTSPATFTPSTTLLMVDAPYQGQPVPAGAYTVIGSATTSTSNTLGNGTLRAQAWYLPHAVPLARIGAEVTVVGEAGSKLRLGIYADDGTLRPGALILDAGQIAGDVVAVADLTISQALQPGLYWVAGAVQAAPTTQPTIRTGGAFIPITMAAVTTSAVSWLHSATVAGALPATFSPSGGSGLTPRIHVRA